MTRSIPIRWLAGVVTAAALVLLGSCGGDSGTATEVITAASPPPGMTGAAYAGYTFMAANGGVQPFSWTESGPLPAGMGLSTSGQLTGTPTTAGTYPIMVTVADSSMPPLTAHVQVSVVINDSPIVVAASPAPPAGFVNAPYLFGFAASGGSPPYTWQVTSGGLPAGLMMAVDGTVSGTPTTIGSYSFSVTATDGAQTPVTGPPLATQIVINNITINNTEAPTGTVGAVYAPFQFSASGGLAPLVWTETGALDGLSLSTGGVLSGIPTTAGKFPIALDVTDALNQVAPSVPIIVRVSLARAGTFTMTGSMGVPRSGHTATLLNTGDVLVSGGGQGAADRSAELYNPATKTFAATGNMTEARIGHTATLLGDSALPHYGEVLIVGSVDTSAELYNPATGVFTASGSMTHARTSPTATLLSNTGPNAGKVLIVGGNTAAGDLTAELYDPAMGTFSDTGSSTILRVGHTTTLLLDGRVLIAGGGTATAELYDPKSGKFAATGSMAGVRTRATATRLQDGTVLIFGGATYGGWSADLYDPAAGTFALVGFNLYSASAQTASLRHDGSVLEAGGYVCHFHRFCASVTTDALFGPESDGFTATGSLNTARDTHTATVLSDGTVLVVGGTHRTVICGGTRCTQGPTTILGSAELFE